jgi:hypothetical protein
MTDPIEVLLKFAFIAVLYLFLLWVARSALKDLSRPTGRGGRDGGTADQALDFGNGFQGGREGGSASCLIVEQGGGLQPGESFRVGAGLTIGRAPGIEIQIDDTYASGRHARVFDREGHVFVEDMNSTNGTYVNGRRVSVQERLRTDDRIRIGDTEFRYEA